MSKQIANLRKQVLNILEKYPKARNSDQWLTIKLWCIYYPSFIKEEAGRNPMEIRKYVYLDAIMALPREDNVKRIRAVIQNEENKFLPTDWKVAKQRKINEDVWKRYIQDQTEYKRI